MNQEKSEKHILSVLVENQPGVLSRVAGLFSGRGFNIESLCVAETLDASVSRITLVTRGDDAVAEQIKKQLNKLINVIKVHEMNGGNFIQRELALIKVKAKADQRDEIHRIVDVFKGRVVDMGREHYVLEITGDEGKLAAILDLLKPIGIKEIARTGPAAMFRDNQTLSS